jgi:sulfide:quinone oxidoreductase
MTKKVVIVGAGAGGTMTANLLAKRLHRRVADGTVSLTLVGEGPDNFFEPANLDIAFKGRDPASAIRSEGSLLRKGVGFEPTRASRIDLQNRSIVLEDSTALGYDYLVIATGSVPVPGAMPGLKEGSLNFHTSPFAAAKIWAALGNLKRGKVVIAITSVPYKCPPSPNEAAFMVDEYYRKRGLRADVEVKFLTPYPRAYPAENVSEVVQRLFDERGIGMVPFFSADHVDPAAKTIFSMEGDSVDYDLLIAVPPHAGAEVIRASGIGDREGWIPADKSTMVMKDNLGVYVLGDASDIPISKSGVVAHLQSKVVAYNIISEIEGGSDLLEYNGRINCPMETGHRRALFVSGTYDVPPGRQNPTFVKYVMKKGFAWMYWSVLRERYERIFDLYFGETSRRVPRISQPTSSQSMAGAAETPAIA